MDQKIFNSHLKQYLCPPGNGVHTVHTANDKKAKLHKKLYQTTEPQQVQTAWELSLEQLSSNKNPVMFGICSDTGGGILRGANWGPLFLRQALNDQGISQDIFDIGDIRVIPHLLHDKYLNTQTITNCRQALYGDKNSLLPVSPLSIAEQFVSDFYTNFPALGLFGIGGDHSVSYPLVKGFLQSQNKQKIKTAVIHFDAHTDLLRERLGIDICFGSWVPHVLEFLSDPSHFIQIGLRSSGKDRGFWEKEFGLKQYWTQEVKDQGPEKIADQIVKHLEAEGIKEIYTSFDIDAIDASYASATGTPETGGLAPHEAAVIMKILFAKFKLKSCDMAEIAPFVNTKENFQGAPEPESTLMVASSLTEIMLTAMR